jgi:hypothetical protein
MWLAVALVVCVVLFFKSPLASATADAIRQGAGIRVRDPRAEQVVTRLTEELNQVREQLSELAERLDFTERALAEVRRRDALPNSRR